MKQQDIERYYFENFRKAYALPAGQLTYADKPDVIIDGAQRIGIEITNFYVAEGRSAASEQVQSGLREKAVKGGHRFYKGSGGKNISLTFSFNESCPIQDTSSLAGRLSAFAHKIDDGENGSISRSLFRDILELDFAYLYARELQYSAEPDPEFPNGKPDLSEGYANWARYRNRREARAEQNGVYLPLQTPGTWKVGQGHDFGLMSTERLTEIIRNKEAKAQQYIPCQKYWLLIVVDAADPAQEQEIRVDGLAVTSNVFEKILI